MGAKYTAAQIAEWFLVRNEMAISTIDADAISPMKLQKLLYYAQGVHLAITGEPLFDDPIEAWTHGPVIRSIYQKYKEFGSNGITKDGYELFEIDKETASILEQVYEVFGQFSAWKLRNMTHEELPWKTTGHDEVICTEKIKDYFCKHYVED